MKAILKLLNNYFWKTIYGPIFAFIFPTLLLVILGNIMRIQYIFPGILAMASMFIAIQSMPLGLMEMKKSTLFKYVGCTPISTRTFTFTIIIYYLMIIFLSLMFLMFVGAFVFYEQVFTNVARNSLYSGILTSFGLFSFFSANFLHIILSLSIGIFIATFSRTFQQALTISLIIMIPSMFLSGMVISVDIIAQSEVMQWISRLCIFRYTTGNIVISSTPLNQMGNIMDLISDKNKTLIFNVIGSSEIIEGKKIYYNIDGVTSWDSTIKQTFTSNQSGLILRPDSRSFEHVGLAMDKNKIITITQLINMEKNTKASEFIFNGGDPTLFNNIFKNDQSLTKSDNNIFNWQNSWGVKRIPDVDLIKSFVVDFLRGSPDKEKDPERIVVIWDEFITKGNFEWLNIFLKQIIVLYTLEERILNSLLPIFVSAITMYFVSQRFGWVSR